MSVRVHFVALSIITSDGSGWSNNVFHVDIPIENYRRIIANLFVFHFMQDCGRNMNITVGNLYELIALRYDTFGIQYSIDNGTQIRFQFDEEIIGYITEGYQQSVNNGFGSLNCPDVDKYSDHGIAGFEI